MFGRLYDDMRRYAFSDQPLRRPLTLRKILTKPGFQAVAVYRLGRWLRSRWRRPSLWPVALLLWPLFGLLQLYVRRAYDIHLAQSADIGAGFYIGHLGGIRVAACRLGRQCAIQQEVQVRPDDGQVPGPDIGGRVWIGPHARVIGPYRIGDGVTVGAGVVVASDVPAAALVMGDPARVVLWNYDNSSFL